MNTQETFEQKWENTKKILHRYARFTFILNILVGSAIGTFIGRSLAVWSMRYFSDYYINSPTPWYQEIIVAGGVSGVMLIVYCIARVVIEHRSHSKLMELWE